jgi:arylsulfatase A-like enzyme
VGRKDDQLNLLLISLDTLRADVAYAGGLPFFETLCKRGTLFRNTVSSAPITPVSHATVFTGLQPYGHGIRHLFKEQLNTPSPTLAELLSSRGYKTGAVVSCPGLNKWYGLNRGFDHYDDEIPRLSDGSDPLLAVDVKLRGTALKRAPLVVERSLDWLSTHRNDPFFVFIHFFDLHWPYEPPEWLAPEGANAYEGEAHYVDHHLGRLFKQIEEWDLIATTLVILFSDHGEDLAGWYPNDHAGPELGHPEEEGHGCLLYDTTQMVPLVLLGPEPTPVNHEVTTQVRLVDVLPTVTDLLHLDDPGSRSGETLAPLMKAEGPHRPAYCETYYREEQPVSPDGISGLGPWKAIRLANRHKIILDVDSGSLAAYDLESDPHECHPIAFGTQCSMFE